MHSTAKHHVIVTRSRRIDNRRIWTKDSGLCVTTRQVSSPEKRPKEGSDTYIVPRVSYTHENRLAFENLDRPRLSPVFNLCVDCCLAENPRSLGIEPCDESFQLVVVLDVARLR